MIGDDVKRFLARAKGTAAEARLVSLDELARSEPEPWGLAAARGRLVELSARGASATLTTAIGIVVEAQTAAEPVAWVTSANASFYPPDVADSGVDLAALVVVRAPSSIAAARAAERLLRSGAFGLVVIDYSGFDSATPRVTARPGEAGPFHASMPAPIQGRLVTLAQAHDAAVVCLTAKADDAASLGSLVSLRAAAFRQRDANGHAIAVRVLKDKRRGPGFVAQLKVRGPPGY